MDSLVFGVDVGGTKIAVLAGREKNETVDILERLEFATPAERPEVALSEILKKMQDLQTRHGDPASIGISCGGPLDVKKGLILSPPNLPAWDHVPIVERLRAAFPVPVTIENDADACAMAEFRYGAGRGVQNMVFLTFGTGLGAGLILNGRLYRGANGGAGEVGHIRLASDGPIGHHKAGSFEGFCSGGGLSKLGRITIEQRAREGSATEWSASQRRNMRLSAKDIAEAAYAGDETALEIMDVCGQKLGEGLAILIDTLNPERIVLGSIFVRCGDLLENAMRKALKQEALKQNLEACQIVPAMLGERVGDVAALSIAMIALAHAENRRTCML